LYLVHSTTGFRYDRIWVRQVWRRRVSTAVLGPGKPVRQELPG
jgi:hypothetical protein